jgi:hypothetical protein
MEHSALMQTMVQLYDLKSAALVESRGVTLLSAQRQPCEVNTLAAILPY